MFLARSKGWPHKAAWFNLGGLGLVINVVALLYGFVMLINFALWHNDAFGDWGNSLRDLTNPMLNTLTFLGSDPLTGLPAWPLFEVTIGVLVIIGVVVYAVGERMQVVGTDIEADAATGEATIG